MMASMEALQGSGGLLDAAAGRPAELFGVSAFLGFPDNKGQGRGTDGLITSRPTVSS